MLPTLQVLPCLPQTTLASEGRLPRTPGSPRTYRSTPPQMLAPRRLRQQERYTRRPALVQRWTPLELVLRTTWAQWRRRRTLRPRIAAVPGVQFRVGQHIAEHLDAHLAPPRRFHHYVLGPRRQAPSTARRPHTEFLSSQVLCRRGVRHSWGRRDVLPDVNERCHRCRRWRCGRHGGHGRRGSESSLPGRPSLRWRFEGSERPRLTTPPRPQVRWSNRRGQAGLALHVLSRVLKQIHGRGR